MRVAILTTSYPSFAGDACGHFVQTEARLLALRPSAEVVVITAGSSADVDADERAGGLSVRRLGGGEAFGWPGIAARVRERPLRILPLTLWVRRARALLRTLGPFDRVIAHWAVPSAFPIARGPVAPGQLRLDVVSHGADVRALARLPPVVRPWVVNQILSVASSWRFVSASLHEELSRALSPRDRARLGLLAFVEPAAMDLPDVGARSAELRSRLAGRPLKVLVGRLVASKRFDFALEAVAARRGPSPYVVVVGDGPERARLEARARRLGLHATFVGRAPREEALAWIGAADGLVHASRAEGLSTVVREATALGVPVEVVP